MTTQLAIIAIALTIGLIIGYALGSKSDVPVKRTIEQMNDAEALRAKVRTAHAESCKLRHGLGLIGLYVCSQKSGTAQKVLRMVQDALS
jgi:hypothetical protein